MFWDSVVLVSCINMGEDVPIVGRFTSQSTAPTTCFHEPLTGDQATVLMSIGLHVAVSLTGGQRACFSTHTAFGDAGLSQTHDSFSCSTKVPRP